MTAIIDYDAGNLKSVEKALKSLGDSTVITRDPDVILSADRVILPGVGAFGDAMSKLREFGLVDAIRQTARQGTPFLGICLGMQLMFDDSEESPGVEGLSLLPGRVLRIPDCPGCKIPHTGWDCLDIRSGSRLLDGIESGAYVYFVHSYYLKAADEAIVAATTEYSTHIHAAVEYNNLYACQFHPEKSSKVGMKILRNFIAL